MIERYSRPAMAAIWSLENKYRKWLEVELLATEAWAELGRVPRQAATELRQRAAFDVDRILAIEERVQHDVIAFTTNVAEHVGEPAKYLHLGLTSSDVVDTGLSLQLVDALNEIEAGITGLRHSFGERARQYKDTVVIGRTHGVHAEPTTFGLKLALYYAEFGRHLERLHELRPRLAVGKLSGAVGNFAQVDPRVESYVCQHLGLTPAPISTQVIQRDRHAELLNFLALVAASIEKFALEVRGLQKTEIREVEEPFREGQKGSSAMPHKRNPRLAEQLCGLSRVVRANALAGLEDIALWHERDISHSSAERIVLPDSTILVDYMLAVAREVLDGMRVYPENMTRNLDATGGLIFSQRLLLALIEKGLSREDAYALVQRAAMQAWAGQATGGPSFREIVAADPALTGRLTSAELAACFDPAPFLQYVDHIFARVGLDALPARAGE
ncbi:MAG: adenylosuccinate lyase [Symbiobacteriia bacterium]